MLFDTHCHLNFKAFSSSIADVIKQAQLKQVGYLVVPGTDVATSEKAIEIAVKNKGVYAAVGIHPHHVYEFKKQSAEENIAKSLTLIKELAHAEGVVAIGEVGLDKHVYQKTKYEHYTVDEYFMSAQKSIFIEQIIIALVSKKSLIIHNREAAETMIAILSKEWDPLLKNRTVFHCCEAHEALLYFARQYGVFIGVDGDITWSKKKQRFIKEVPLTMLVLETDAPFLTPEPIREKQPFPNKPENLMVVAKTVAQIKNCSYEEVAQQTYENSLRLFNLNTLNPSEID